jgi:hypothetical protein
MIKLERDGRACSNVLEILALAEKKGLSDKKIGSLAGCSTVALRRWRESGRGDYSHVSRLFTALQEGGSSSTGILLADASLEDLTARAWELGFEASFRYTGKPIITEAIKEIAKPIEKPSQFRFEGKEYGQGRLVLAVVKAYVNKHACDYQKLAEEFPARLQGSLDVVARIEDIKDPTRYFTKDDDIVILHDGERVAVCNQWGWGATPNTPKFIKKAEDLGYVIQPIF